MEVHQTQARLEVLVVELLVGQVLVVLQLELHHFMELVTHLVVMVVLVLH
jgi:hypothetical protein